MNNAIEHIMAQAYRVPDSVSWATVGIGAFVNAVSLIGSPAMTASDFALISTGIACLCAAALSAVKIWCKLNGRGDSQQGGKGG